MESLLRLNELAVLFIDWLWGIYKVDSGKFLSPHLDESSLGRVERSISGEDGILVDSRMSGIESIYIELFAILIGILNSKAKYTMIFKNK